jgi:3-oxoacyl-[acyl-carrier-protein] synthase-1
MNKVYITGSSIICALGNNKEESIKKIEQINDTNYSNYLKEFRII